MEGSPSLSMIKYIEVYHSCVGRGVGVASLKNFKYEISCAIELREAPGFIPQGYLGRFNRADTPRTFHLSLT